MRDRCGVFVEYNPLWSPSWYKTWSLAVSGTVWWNRYWWAKRRRNHNGADTNYTQGERDPMLRHGESVRHSLKGSKHGDMLWTVPDAYLTQLLSCNWDTSLLYTRLRYLPSPVQTPGLLVVYSVETSLFCSSEIQSSTLVLSYQHWLSYFYTNLFVARW